MSTAPELERCRTEADLRSAYARGMAEQAAAGPHELAVLRERFRLRRGELRRGVGGDMHSRADWIVACLESSVPDEGLEAELLRLTTEDAHLDVPRLRTIQAAREEWRSARVDPRIPGVVLHVLERRLGVPPRSPAIAEDVAHPQEVAQLIREEYPQIHALDPQMFTHLQRAAPRAASTTDATERALQRHQKVNKKSGRWSFWTIVFVIWLVARLLSWLGSGSEPAPEARGPDRAPPFEYVSTRQFGEKFDRISRRLAHVERLRKYVHKLRTDTPGPLHVSNAAREEIRALLDRIPISVVELQETRSNFTLGRGFPGSQHLEGIENQCWRAITTLNLKQAEAQLRFSLDRRHPLETPGAGTPEGDK